MMQSKLAEIPKKAQDIAAQRRKESAERRRLTYWAIRSSDDRIAKTNEVIDRTRSILKVAGKPRDNGGSESDPFLAMGDLLIHGSENPKRRADDR